MRQWNSGIRGNRKCRTYPRHNLKWDTCGRESLGFLAAPSKEKRIAALKSHHALSLQRAPNQLDIDLVLWSLSAATDLAGLNTFDIGAGVVEDVGIDQRVVDDHIARRDQVARLTVNKPGSPGPAPTRYINHSV